VQPDRVYLVPGEIGEIHHAEEKLHELGHGHVAKHEHGKHDDHDHDDKEPAAKKKAKTDKKDEKADKEAKAKKKEIDDLETELEVLKARSKFNWEGHLEWARINPSKKSVSDVDRGTVLTLGFRIDMLAAVMFVMVSFIATLIHLFSIGYMSDELQKTVEDHEVHTAHGHLERRGRFGRFFMFLSLFCFSMLNLVLADNLFQVFVSWELVGICSYLLISFYFERTSASNAANKAFITNRIGDAGFIIGLMIVWTYFGTLNFQEVFARIRSPEMDSHDPILVDGTSAQHKIIRGNVGPTEGTSSTLTLAPDGDSALIFPRDQGHFHAAGRKSFRFPASRRRAASGIFPTGCSWPPA